MKRIAILHTVKNVYLSFGDLIRAEMPDDELEISNTLDEFLAGDANRNGFTRANLNRLRLILEAMDIQEADLIVVSCSTLSPGIKKIRPFLSTPVIAIDDGAVKKAIRMGNRIAVLASSKSALEAMAFRLKTESVFAGKLLSLTEFLEYEAFLAMQRSDMETHDRLLRNAAKNMGEQDCIVLAQASMAHLETGIGDISKCPVLSTPGLCIEEIRKTLYPGKVTDEGNGKRTAGFLRQAAE
jgi:glutamate racemase